MVNNESQSLAVSSHKEHAPQSPLPHDHHDHHDHHEHYQFPILEAPLEIDYSRFDEKFDNRPVIRPEVFKGLDFERQEYIRNNALSWENKIDFPMNLKGLDIKKYAKTPSTRKWYRQVSSFERNGMLNVWTIKLNLKLKYWLFYPFLLFGMTNVVWEGMYFREHDFSNDSFSKVYEKLIPREIPFARVWTRPG